MRITQTLVAAVGLASLAQSGWGAPSDVPPGHWAAGAVKSVTAKKIMTAETDGKFHGSQPVTRYELAVALDRFVRYIEVGRKPLSPIKPGMGAKIFPGASPAAKAALTRLTVQGYLPAASPLLKGAGSEPVTAQQLADALSQVTVRISDLSLPPDKD